MSPLTSYLVETLITLAVVIGLAFLVLAGAKKLGLGRPHGPMHIVGRLPLDARRSLFLVQIADQCLILGTSEAGITKLGEIQSQTIEQVSKPAPKSAFADILAALRHAPTSRKEAQTPGQPPEPDNLT